MPFKKVYVKKTKPGGATHWDESKKIEAVQAYILLGQLRMAAATINVPEATVKVWKASQWWKDMEYELRRSSKIQLSAKLNEVVGKTITQLKDRVENGDHIYNPRTQEFVRKPISAEHANKIIKAQIDTMQQLDKASSVEKVDEVGIAARLEKLKQDLIKGFTKPQLAQRVIEGDIIEVPSEPSRSVSSDSRDLACSPDQPDQATNRIENLIQEEIDAESTRRDHTDPLPA